METQTDDECQGSSSKGSKDSNPENESASAASNSSMDSFCSIASSPNNIRANDSRKSNNISELVGKSKKAAFSLWTLLHAKNCRLGVDRCSHPGCSEAKMMYLHHKTCSAEHVEPCPTQHKGCQDARKLLAHYRRCRDIRARQSQNPKNRQQQHVCLVCSLVARHAKFTLDRTASHASKNGTTSHYIPSLNLSHDMSNGKRNRSFSMATYLSSSKDSNQQPRFAFSRRPKNSGDGASGLQALQAAVSCALNSNTSSYATNTAKKPLGGKQSLHRPRAESLDVRSYQQLQRQKNKEEKNMSYLYLAAVDNFSDEITEDIPKKNSNVRRRSQSCTVPSNTKQAATGGGNTILQKSTIAEDLQYILGGGL
mmetsp:Transcript_7227/g.15610  ORF Transcript_7227/g.15610 Transcript_7227/m.15610 type:complete len:367 (+) Transcript_7227:239-1339(+)|eukprot:CAMPEP_0201209206 /NCGR_PEP_ID=MMETSP0851-20130426/177857_1 /ASSEMBLY_ACC=CAM_ASM_000631 /TAXON_ID=183588 /ORGANISM="Pseudo-nitzschia fraudulenta, Strain WWA7" /LENGTH=366 /DNA_ID=CAMNT_0047497845 /DNA_START=201 /DNA_END=1301 /DNA_ORIENTATION=-